MMKNNTLLPATFQTCHNVTYNNDHIWWFDVMKCNFNDLPCFQQWNTIHVIALLSTTASFFASIYIIITGTYYNSKIKNVGITAQVPIFISICDCLFEACHGSDHAHNILTGHLPEGIWCTFFGSMKPFSINIQSVWALATGFCLFRTIMPGNDNEPSFGKYNLFLHIPSWGLPIIGLIIGFVYDVYDVYGVEGHIMYVVFVFVFVFFYII